MGGGDVGHHFWILYRASSSGGRPIVNWKAIIIHPLFLCFPSSSETNCTLFKTWFGRRRSWTLPGKFHPCKIAWFGFLPQHTAPLCLLVLLGSVPRRSARGCRGWENIRHNQMFLCLAGAQVARRSRRARTAAEWPFHPSLSHSVRQFLIRVAYLQCKWYITIHCAEILITIFSVEKGNNMHYTLLRLLRIFFSFIFFLLPGLCFWAIGEKKSFY